MATSPNLAGLPGPDTLKFHEWAYIAVEQLADFGLPSPPVAEADWAHWASSFNNGGMPGTPVPDPYGFATWQDWAYAVVGTIS